MLHELYTSILLIFFIIKLSIIITFLLIHNICYWPSYKIGVVCVFLYFSLFFLMFYLIIILVYCSLHCYILCVCLRVVLYVRLMRVKRIINIVICDFCNVFPSCCNYNVRACDVCCCVAFQSFTFFFLVSVYVCTFCWWSFGNL